MPLVSGHRLQAVVRARVVRNRVSESAAGIVLGTAEALKTPGIARFDAPVLLWIAPEWAPIRKDPKFRARLATYAKDRPATASAARSSP